MCRPSGGCGRSRYTRHKVAALVFEEPVEVGWGAVGAGGGEVDVRGDVGGFGDEAEDDVGALAEVEVVLAGGEGLGPDSDGERFGSGDRAGQDQVPLLGGG